MIHLRDTRLADDNMGATVAEAQQKKDKKKDKKDKNAKAVSVEEPQAGPSNVEDASKESKKNKKRSKELKEDTGSAEAQDKRNKKRAADEDEAADDTCILAAQEGEKKKKKRKTKSLDSIDSEAEKRVDGGTEAGEGEKKKKKRMNAKEREEHISIVESGPSEATVDGASKKKSKKRKDRKADDPQDTAEDAPEEKTKPKKKRKRGKTGFPDPEEADSLSEQARKALSYAYLQAEEPSSWKFNKARQNWLLRNIWSEEAIPDVHVPLTKQYLSGVQGGVRETLIKTCREVLAAKPVEEPKPQAIVEPTPAPAESAEKSAVKTKVKVKFAVPEESAKVPAALQLKQRRAKELLEVLTGEKASDD